MTEVIFKTIRTPEGFYAYDRSTNTIVAVTEKEYDELKTLRMEENPGESSVIQRFQKKGLFYPNRVETIQHPYTEALAHLCQNSLSSLVLQVTQQCNLRCSYCAYSGLYYNREHNSQRMSFETAQKAIDFFLSRAGETQDLNFGFYGGEPLLEFDLIKRCVAYIRTVVEGKPVSFNLTTNGTLLTDEKIEYFYQNDFALTISLDGAKKEHDACRVFPNGQGSFDVVMRNVRRVKELHPEYAKKLLVSTVISPQADLNHVLEYFETDEILADTFIMMNQMVETGLKEQVDYEESFHLVRRYEMLKFLLFLIGKVDRRRVSKLVIRSQNLYENLYRSLQKHTVIQACAHHGGPCIPGVKKLFVSVAGTFFPCEKVNECAECTQIGSLETGFNLENMRKLLNVGMLTAEECKNCWALPNCKICVEQIDCANGQEELKKADKLISCENSKGSLMTELYQMCVLHEFGYRLNEEAVVL